MQQDEHSPADDADLMKRLAAGDKSALGTLVERHQRRVVGLAMRLMRDRAAAEDIAQDAFVRVWRSSEHYEPRAEFATWLYRIVINLCLDAVKKRRPIAVETPEPPPDEASDPAVRLDRDDRIGAVRDAVAALPGRQRVAVILHRYSDLSVRQISEATGWSESAVESLLVRAYAGLRQSLGGATEAA